MAWGISPPPTRIYTTIFFPYFAPARTRRPPHSTLIHKQLILSSVLSPSNMRRTTRILVLLLGAVLSAALLGGATAGETPPTRRLVGARRLAGNGPSDLFNALLKGVAPALEKEIGHMKFKNYDHKGVKLTNLRTFDFDCSDGCLSGKISDDLKSVSLSVHKFSLRIHSRYKAKKGFITVQGQCDFQLKDTKGSGGGTISSLSPFKLSGVHVDVDVGKIVPSCGGLSGGIVNVMVHLFQDKIKHTIADAAENAIKDVLQGGGGKKHMNLFESLLAGIGLTNNVGQPMCGVDGESCSSNADCCGNGICVYQRYCGHDCCDNGANEDDPDWAHHFVSEHLPDYYSDPVTSPFEEAPQVDLSLVIAEALGGDAPRRS